MFKTLDKDSSGGLTEAELLTGFAAEFKVEALTDHVISTIKETFAKVATADAADGKSLKPGLFSRFYCEVIFNHFDTNQNGTLQVAEAQAALAYMNKAGNEPLYVAFPPQFSDAASGELRLPIQWFWKLFSAME